MALWQVETCMMAVVGAGAPALSCHRMPWLSASRASAMTLDVPNPRIMSQINIFSVSYLSWIFCYSYRNQRPSSFAVLAPPAPVLPFYSCMNNACVQPLLLKTPLMKGRVPERERDWARQKPGANSFFQIFHVGAGAQTLSHPLLLAQAH